MSQAKAQKMKEYGTDLISHDSSIQNQGTVRANNTFKSSIMSQDTESVNPRQAKSRDRMFTDNPLTTKIQRASYQDSNIFGYKDSEDPTIQSSAARDQRQSRTRQNPTFSSRVFSDSTQDEPYRPPSSTRKEENWQSTIFEGPVIEQSRRKKLGQSDAGVATLFGQDQCDFDNRSNNMAIIGGAKKTPKKWAPVRQQKTAEQRKNDELYGRSAAIYGTGKKGDGTLMANGTNWRNPQQTHINSPVKAQHQNKEQGNCKEKKFENLSSNIFGNDDNQDRPLYNPDAEKASMGTDANWTAQAGSSKIINKGVKVDTFKKKQQNLTSQVFEQTDYSEHVPMKKSSLDINNLADKKRQADHLYSDIFGNSHASSFRTPSKNAAKGEQIKKEPRSYTSMGKKADFLRSSLDTHNFEATAKQRQVVETPEKAIMVPGKHSQATKIRDLSSDVLGTGNTLQNFNENQKSTMFDLDLKGLPDSTQADDLKKLSGVKHVISATIDSDSIRNVCLGTGRIKLRLTEAEDIDSVKIKFLKAGYGVQDHEENPKKKSNFTCEQNLQNSSPQKTDVNAKMSKVQNLQSSNPSMFGNQGAYQAKHVTGFDPSEKNEGNQAALSESLAQQSWNKVGGRK